MGGADLRRGPLGWVGWIFFENFYHKILLRGRERGVGGVGLGNLERNLGSNRGYFLKIGGQLAGKEEEMWATIGNISWK